MRVQSAGAGTAYEKPTPGLRQTPQTPRQVSDRTKERGDRSYCCTYIRTHTHGGLITDVNRWHDCTWYVTSERGLVVHTCSQIGKISNTKIEVSRWGGGGSIFKVQCDASIDPKV